MTAKPKRGTERRACAADPVLALRVREAEDLAAAAARRVREQRVRLAALERTGNPPKSAGVLLRAFEESLAAHTRALAALRADLVRR